MHSMIVPFGISSPARRFVEMTENLVVWLEPLKLLLQDRLSYPYYRGARDRAKESAGLTWHQDILRHSFASYHLALGENAGKTSLEMGHSNQNMLFEAYRELVTKEDAQTYFGLLPCHCEFYDVKAIYKDSPSALPQEKIIKIA